MLSAIDHYQQHVFCIKNDPLFSPIISAPGWEKLGEQKKRFVSPQAQGYARSLNADNPLVSRVEALKPWRKGPFQMGEFFLDAEWRCDAKWERVESLGITVATKRVLDLGCGNGYYMFRMAEQNPSLVCGLDPSALYFFQFQLAHHFNPMPNLYFLPLGWQDLDVFCTPFDTVFCMGVLYHHPDPVALLKQCGLCLEKGGELVLETLVLEGKSLAVLTPHPQRYACMPNVYAIPTLSRLEHWLYEAGFSDIRFGEVVPTTPSEQRVTSWGPQKSLVDFLDPEDPSKTLEGFPAPKRVICSSVRD